MDEISVELRMSKKTIYKHFPTKDKLVDEVAHFTINIISEKVDAIINSDVDTLSKITGLIELFGSFITHFSEKWLYDIKVHMPVVWDKIDSFRTKKIYSIFSKIIEQGKKENLFIDFPNEIVITVFVASLRAIVNPDFLFHNRFSYKEAFRLSMELLFNGILTAKGKKLFKKVMSEKS
jgi:AcrR family transcriptional regulator